MNLRSLFRPSHRQQARATDQDRTPTPFLELLPDWQLDQLNEILSWNCYTVDSLGRKFGKPHGRNKRPNAQTVPDRRILSMHNRFDLSDKAVLEVGCFEGVHTSALAQLAKRVIAVDARLENVVKTMVRVGFFGRSAQVVCCDLESLDEKTKAYLKADLVHHVGVLYHLVDPVAHLAVIRSLAPKGLMLDTHFATPEMATQQFESGGKSYRYFHFREPNSYQKVFAGMHGHAKWLPVDDLKAALVAAGYAHIEIVETRQERNGPRLLLFAWND